MRRVSRDWYKLSEQLASAGRGIMGEPAWPLSAPSQATVEAAGANILSLRTQIVEAENLLGGLRSSLESGMDDGTRLMRQVDFVTSGLYGEDGAKKINFGLRPVDKTRNSPGKTPQVIKLFLTDGAGSGVIAVRWKSVPRATYEVQWFTDAALENLLGAMVTTKSQALIPALAPGVQIWLRVRALRGGRFGDWSETATRIANV